jgi:Zn ribbon nucleic-acid-binding protein
MKGQKCPKCNAFKFHLLSSCDSMEQLCCNGCFYQEIRKEGKIESSGYTDNWGNYINYKPTKSQVKKLTLAKIKQALEWLSEI